MDEKKCCEFVNQDYSTAVSYIQTQLSSALIKIADGDPIDGGPNSVAGKNVSVRQLLAMETLTGDEGMRKLLQDAYQKILDSKCNDECCQAASSSIETISKAYVNAILKQIKNIALLDSSLPNNTALEDYVDQQIKNFANDLELITSTTDCNKCHDGKKGGRKRRTRYKIECDRRRDCDKKRSFKKYSCSVSEKEPCDCSDEGEH